MRRAVRAVTADFVGRTLLFRQSVDIGLGRHRLMKRGVENHNLRHRRQFLHDRANNQRCRRIVQRRQRRKRFDVFDHFLGNDDRTLENRTALNNTMADGRNLVQISDNAVGQQFHDFVQRRFMIGQIYLDLLFVAVGIFDADKRSVAADTLGIALGNNFIAFAVNVKQLIFQRR